MFPYASQVVQKEFQVEGSNSRVFFKNSSKFVQKFDFWDISGIHPFIVRQPKYVSFYSLGLVEQTTGTETSVWW